MALLEQTFLDLHFMNAENGIFIRQSQTELVTVVLGGPSLFSLPPCLPVPSCPCQLHFPHFPETPMASGSSEEHPFITWGEEHEEGGRL